MFTINKIYDKEWYHRKWITFLHIFLSDTSIQEIEHKHKISQVYKLTFGKSLHWHHPRTLNEKLIWLSWYWRNPLIYLCADKYKVHEYVSRICGLPESLLVPIIAVYNSVEEIDYDSLPEQFVLKCNHGCGYNILVPKKSIINRNEVNYKLNNWLLEHYRGGGKRDSL